MRRIWRWEKEMVFGCICLDFVKLFFVEKIMILYKVIWFRKYFLVILIKCVWLFLVIFKEEGLVKN